ncbi:uncharacterized protein LOC131148549 [Malania oleifera]|uniref:uncharacterized protein LOC131148549 n=1 Tax=Malania oleifera TaxID=397392 RepID=UPI0025AE9537|nr:uncharacterized protein LOC131148549 [Malania oleifera]
MKKSGLLAASVAAASATAISASPSSSVDICNSQIQNHEEAASRTNEENSPSQKPASTDKFAPRFDGLRFIETLITAHR